MIMLMITMINTACQCNLDGSRGEVCNHENGQCRCYTQIIGRTCDTCAQEGYYGPIKHCCIPCRCHLNNTLECTTVSDNECITIVQIRNTNSFTEGRSV